MNDYGKSPPTWASTIFYLLIIIVLLMCVVTFILKGSCLFNEPSLRSISYSIATFGVGLSLICGILWIGGVVGVVKISKATQKALWATLIAAVLSITVTAYKGFFSTPTVYNVTGSIKKIDNKDPRDISISTRYPPLFPVPLLIEKNLAFEVWEEPNGKLPKLVFSHPDYAPQEVDLNDRTKVESKNSELIILDPIILSLVP